MQKVGSKLVFLFVFRNLHIVRFHNRLIGFTGVVECPGLPQFVAGQASQAAQSE